ncbi:RNA 2',3'-cyclic phosphodiesterase [Blastococcus brunescens]|uniref:RNA 2',3'-cyclic phosphodiesterase n=1 Tax=Blastococcus brunescens TaxID=1564165 RepID=A0ABZ1BBR9_9ACTN|nr:RNA 2',3'-cyclic phosphodiesterase [Blastococcus sp. BMG 8361]WRL66820.1 RNA 2',3'-cyclic phosphodiesterase [Blastococcus sp. BMG 8361]
MFLGTVPEERVAALVAAAAPAVAATPAVTLRLAGGGRFGSARRPQVAWAGLDGDVAPLVALAGRLTDVARGLGLPVEDRPFRPHLTLGRWRPGQPADGTLTDRLAGYRGPSWPVTEVRLWESHLGSRPTYDVVATWSVGQA